MQVEIILETVTIKVDYLYLQSIVDHLFIFVLAQKTANFKCCILELLFSHLEHVLYMFTNKYSQLN